MKKNIFLKILIPIASLIFESTSAFGDYTDVFKLIPKTYADAEQPNELSNFPRERNQSVLPICQTISAYYIATYYHCKVNNINPCSKIPPEKDMSILDITSKCRNRDESGARFQTNLFETKDGANLFNCLTNINKEGRIQSELCFSYDKFISKFKGNENLLATIKVKIEKHYDNYKKNKTEGRFCEECFIKDVYEGFFDFEKPAGFKMPPANYLLMALDSSTLDSMWYDLLVSSCKNQKKSQVIDLEPEPIAKFLPDYARDIPPLPDKQSVKNKIKEVLKKGWPIGIGICIQESGPNCTGHNIVISGYRKVCKNNGGSQDCRDVFKVENSWGPDFYPKNPDGTLNKWFDADSLFNLTPPSRIELAWYEKP